MEVLAGFLLGYLVGTETGAQGMSVVKDALGKVAGSADVQSMLSGGVSSAEGLFGGLLGGGGGSKEVTKALSDLASSDEVRGVLSTGLSTATGLVFDLVGRGKDLVSQRGGLSLVG